MTLAFRFTDYFSILFFSHVNKLLILDLTELK